MTTNARPTTRNDAHWYNPDGSPCFEIPKADGKGTRSPTIADARKFGLLPSVTTILKVINKPELINWIVEQAVLAVLTSPRRNGETLDDFVHRVLHVEKVQEKERESAADRGRAIHDACEAYFTGQEVDSEIRPWIEPAVKEITNAGGNLVCAERNIVGEGYAGRLDLVWETPEVWQVWDFKHTKKLPEKGAWNEHVLQCSAYAAALERMLASAGTPVAKPIRTANCYISSVEQGKFVCHYHDPDWPDSYRRGFYSFYKGWCYLNNFYPAPAK